MKEKKKQKNIKLILSKELSHTVSYLHRKVGDKEWSGILLYSVESGDISDPSSLVLQARDIYVMDVGISTYTEYDFGTVITDVHKKFPLSDPFKAQDEGRAPWKIGHIHTHHKMDTFFSPTDLRELEDNSPHHSFYLSLIANFKSEYKAKVAICGDVEETKKLSWKDGTGKVISMQNTTNSKKMFAFDCDISFEGMEGVDIKMEELKKSKKKAPNHIFGGQDIFKEAREPFMKLKNPRNKKPLDISPNQQSLVGSDEFIGESELSRYLASLATLGSDESFPDLESAFHYVDNVMFENPNERGEDVDVWSDVIIDNAEGMFHDMFPNTLLSLGDIANGCRAILSQHSPNFDSAEIMSDMFSDITSGVEI
jgi:hypothetical protein